MHTVSIKFMEIMTLLRTDFSNYLGTLGHSGYLEVSPNGKKKKCFTSKWRNQRNGHTKYTKEWTSLIITSMSHKTETDAGWDSHHF